MANGKIRVRLRAFDVELIDQSAKAIVQTVQKAGAKVISNCSRDFLFTCGERKTVILLILVGSGIGPETFAPAF